MRVLRHGSLFSGIGGFDLAAQWMGWENVFQCEIDNYCQKVLTKNFPNTVKYHDIKQFNGEYYRGTIDVLSGGFPCQPYSIAGQRKGTEDDRHLWPEMLRIIGEIQPRWVVGENVPGLLNWEGGLVLQQIKTDLENQGFSVFPPAILPACGKNAPHKRDRLWIIAHSEKGAGNNENRNEGYLTQEIQEKRPDEFGTFTNSNETRLQGSAFIGSIGSSREDSRKQPTGLVCSDFENFPTQPPICGGNDGIPNRMDRIAGLGNAIVPQVAYEIFKAIASCE